MTREEILKSRKLLKRFCKDNNLPINLYEEPYFTQRLETLDEIFHCKDAFRIFVEEVGSFKNEQDYLEHYNAIKDRIITHIKEQPKFQEFNEMEMDYPKPEYGSRDFYKMPLNEKTIVSIDMKKANFTALSYYSKDIFLGAGTWEEFMENFTNLTHLKKSKYIRQVILGACNPKRQVRYEKYLMTLLLKDILPRLEGLEIYSLSNDEIILVPLEEMDSPDLYQMVKDAVDDTEFAEMVRVSLFYLKKLPVTDGWRRDIFCDGVISYDFKKMNADYYHQAVKHFRGEPITEDDLVLYHDGKLARLFCPVF